MDSENKMNEILELLCKTRSPKKSVRGSRELARNIKATKGKFHLALQNMSSLYDLLNEHGKEIIKERATYSSIAFENGTAPLVVSIKQQAEVAFPIQIKNDEENQMEQLNNILLKVEDNFHYSQDVCKSGIKAFGIFPHLIEDIPKLVESVPRRSSRTFNSDLDTMSFWGDRDVVSSSPIFECFQNKEKDEENKLSGLEEIN